MTDRTAVAVIQRQVTAGAVEPGSALEGRRVAEGFRPAMAFTAEILFPVMAGLA